MDACLLLGICLPLVLQAGQLLHFSRDPIAEPTLFLLTDAMTAFALGASRVIKFGH